VASENLIYLISYRLSTPFSVNSWVSLMLSIGLCVARKFLTRGVDVGLGIRKMKKGRRGEEKERELESSCCGQLSINDFQLCELCESYPSRHDFFSQFSGLGAFRCASLDDLSS
jgi:hypothetical protein